MISINATVFVQIANFFLVYWFLHRALFTPIIRRILKRKLVEKRLKDEILVKGRDIINFRNEKNLQLKQFQKDAIPEHVKTLQVSREITLVTPYEEREPVALSSEEQARVLKEIKEVIGTLAQEVSS